MSEIDAVENLCGTAYAYSRTNGIEPVTIELKDDRSVREGQRLATGSCAERAFLFEANTGRRLC